MGWRRRHVHGIGGGMLVLVLSLAVAPHARGTEEVAPPVETATTDTRARHLYVGMWTLHFGSMSRGVDNNWLLGVLWGKTYGATFINSYGKRGYSAGVQNVLVRGDEWPLPVDLGYRVGLVTGYDERFIGLARKLPALPIAQLLINTGGRLGMELSFAGLIASAGLSVRL